MVGSSCKEDTCTKVTRFDPAASSSFKRSNPPVHLEITFGTGKISGVTGIDNFTVGPFVVRDQSFGLVESEGGHNAHGNIFKVGKREGGRKTEKRRFLPKEKNEREGDRLCVCGVDDDDDDECVSMERIRGPRRILRRH